MTLCAGDAATVSEPAVTDFSSDCSFLSPSVVKTMLHELEDPQDELKSLTSLISISGLTGISSEHTNCSTSITDVDHKIIASDICTPEISHKMQKPKYCYNHLSEARARVSKLEQLKENSRQMVSRFIPPNAPKLSFASDVIGMCCNYL